MKMLDNRRTRRKATLIHAFASDLNDIYDVKCVIRDVSRSGCRIVSSQLDDLPTIIKLLPEGFAKPVRGKIVWRDDKIAGVAFLSSGGGVEAITPEGAAPVGFLAKMQKFATQGRRHGILRGGGAQPLGAKPTSDFIAMLVHDLRSPLAALTHALDLIRSGTLGRIPARLKSAFDVVSRNAGRLSDFVAELFEVRKLETGGACLDLEPLDLSALTTEAVAKQKAEAGKRGVAFAIDDQLGEPWVEADARRIAQALAHLLTNAVTFAPAGSTVTVTLAPAGEAVRLSVSDEGPGVPAHMQQKIFEKLVQGERPGGARRTGTGLGLSAAKAILEGHGGTVHLVSEPGQGATFSFDLKRTARPRETVAIPA